jgi:hypothetical protein
MAFTTPAPGASTTTLRAAPASRAQPIVGPALARGLILAAVAGAALAGFLATDPATAARATAHAGEGLTRLLRAMAAIKAAMAAGALAGMLWRLGSPVSAPWLAAYAVAAATMAAGPGLVWNMADLGAGALLLHAGLLGAVILLWRDPAVGRRIAAIVDARRAARAD